MNWTISDKYSIFIGIFALFFHGTISDQRLTFCPMAFSSSPPIELSQGTCGIGVAVLGVNGKFRKNFGGHG